MVGVRRAGQEKYYEGAHHALEIARLNSACRFGINTGKHPMQKLDAAPPGDRLQTAAHLDIGSRAGKEAAHERTVVQARAADDDGPVSAPIDLLDRCDRITRIPGSRVFVG